MNQIKEKQTNKREWKNGTKEQRSNQGGTKAIKTKWKVCHYCEKYTKTDWRKRMKEQTRDQMNKQKRTKMQAKAIEWKIKWATSKEKQKKQLKIKQKN